jgi:hypothetical protein
MSLFEKATRMKLRFPTNKGLVSTEDLWDLSLTALDKLAQAFYKTLQAGSEISFIGVNSSTDEVSRIQFDTVKHVIDVKLVEKEQAENAALRKAQKQEILALIADKKSEALKGKSLDELTEMLNNL